jgi:hypothetical protein
VISQVYEFLLLVIPHARIFQCITMMENKIIFIATVENTGPMVPTCLGAEMNPFPI